MSGELPSVRVVRFWTDYQPQPDGSIKSIEKAELAPRGFGKYTSTPWRVVDLKRDTSGLWEVVRPSYEAWKAGQEAPVDGTPLAAWSGVTPQQAEILKFNHVRSVEDIASLTDAQMERIPLPGLRVLRDQARAWEKAADQRSVAADLARKDEELAILREQMAELQAALARDPDQEPVKRRPGRPRKDEADPSEAA